MIDELFTRYDRDRSGSLDRSELGAVFNEVLARFNMGFTISQSEAEALLYQIDNNRDGKIGKPELFNCLRNLVINESTKPAVNRW
jgi:Ca2+-binding EF-hand superfamily protein